MGDLFSSFNPETEIIFLFPGNWIACISVLIIIPQSYWIVPNNYKKFFNVVIMLIMEELKAVFGSLVTPGTFLVFMTFFTFILMNNFLGLLPYVFTSSSHLSLTLGLALPLWVGKMIISAAKQMESNLAHLVPEGTPAPLLPVMVIIETVSLIIRPMTLAVRLAANMVAGHLLLALLGGQGPMVSGGALSILLMGLLSLIILECSVACIQAYVFTILSSLYVSEHNSTFLMKN